MANDLLDKIPDWLKSLYHMENELRSSARNGLILRKDEALNHLAGFWALYGLKEAAKAKGDAAAEAKAADELAKAWRGDPSLLTLERL